MHPTLSPNPPSPLYTTPSNPPHRSHAPVRVALLRTAWVCLCLHAQPDLSLVNLQPVSFRVFPRRAPNPPAMCAKPPALDLGKVEVEVRVGVRVRVRVS